MAARSKARKRALDILYAAEVRGQDPVAAMDEAIAEGEGPTNPYTETLVRGVGAHRERIDELLTSYSQGWTLDRMPAVDRNALRHRRLRAPLRRRRAARGGRRPRPWRWCVTLSTDDSPAFVNGVLGSMLRDRELAHPLGCCAGRLPRLGSAPWRT